MSGGGEPPGRGAHNRTRTDDLFLTKEVLCQLSYVGPGPIASSLVGREGIEPRQPKAAGLHPAELTTCATYPLWQRHRRGTAVPGVNPPPDHVRYGADDGTRTRNLLFTKQLLYQLSYVGATRRVIPQMTPSAPGNDRARRSDGSSVPGSGGRWLVGLGCLGRGGSTGEEVGVVLVGRDIRGC